MDVALFTLVVGLGLAFVLWAWILRSVKSKLKKKPAPPPGPKPYPLIGNILELGSKPHRSLAHLSKTYGPLMQLKLGSLTTVIVSSPEVARMVLQKHDQVFSNRLPPDAVHALDHHMLSVAWMPAQNQWRKLRKISREQMFSVSSLDASQGLRREKLTKLREYVRGRCVQGETVVIGKAAFTTSLNLMSASLFSEEFAAFDSDSAQELKKVVWGIMEAIGTPNIADYFPILRWVDPRGILKKNTVYFKKCFEIFDGIIDRKLKSRREYPVVRCNDMLEALLDVYQKDESELSLDDIKHLLLDLFVAGTDTTSSTVEWAMTELLRNPDKMLKIKTELTETVGKNEEVTESDIAKLPYLRAVVKETFRLHPAAPLLVPHMAQNDIEVNGYTVPKGAQILINAWCIGRDPSIWASPESFRPERFLEVDTDFRGQHFELLPFGGGRRICLGLPLANRMIHLMLATFIHKFDWKVDGEDGRELDMSENFGLTLQKAIPLKAIPLKV